MWRAAVRRAFPRPPLSSQPYFSPLSPQPHLFFSSKSESIQPAKEASGAARGRLWTCDFPRSSRRAPGASSQPLFLAAFELRVGASPDRERARARDGRARAESITLTKEEADAFNRWSIMPRAFAIHIPTGAVYVWSMWQGPLAQSLGVLTPAAGDWSMGSVATTFSCLALGFGASVGFAGPWMAAAGPRYASLLGTALFAGGYALSAAGVQAHARRSCGRGGA